MRISCFVLLCAVSAGCVWAEQKCQLQGGVRMYKGKKCASTTRYDDGHMGSCGCGHGHDTPFGWVPTHLVAAASQKLFDPTGKSWCGQSCGKCIKLTTTGGFVPRKGRSHSEGQSHVFMITNDCPDRYPFSEWCGQKGVPGTGHGNTYGYEVHFDLENHSHQIDKLGWDNPEVTWEWTNCNGQNTPTYSMYHSCQCAH